MKWWAYREYKKKQSLKISHKKMLFSRIQNTIASENWPVRKSLLTRRSFYVRPVARVAWVLMLWVAVFLLTYVSDTFQTQKNSSWIVVVAPVATTTVQANPLWRIITAQWMIRVEQDGKLFDVTDISEWQLVILDVWARVVLAIDESVEATITWPARFSLETYDENTTLLNLMQWTYAEVKTLATPEDVNIKEINLVEMPKRDLIVKTKALEIATTSQEWVDITIDSTNQEKAKITNEWSSIIVKNLDTTESIAIDTNHIAIRDLTDSLIAADVSQAQISSLKETDNKKQLLAIRYEANDEQSTALSTFLEEWEDNQMSANENLDDTPIGIDESILQALIEQDDVLTGDEEDIEQNTEETTEPVAITWRVIEPERMQRLQSILNANSLNSYTKKYLELSDDLEKQSLVLEDLVNTINRALSQFNRSWANTASKENLIKLTDSLLNVLTNNYFIPPSLIQPLITLQIALLQ